MTLPGTVYFVTWIKKPYLTFGTVLLFLMLFHPYLAVPNLHSKIWFAIRMLNTLSPFHTIGIAFLYGSCPILNVFNLHLTSLPKVLFQNPLLMRLHLTFQKRICLQPLILLVLKQRTSSTMKFGSLDVNSSQRKKEILILPMLINCVFLPIIALFFAPQLVIQLIHHIDGGHGFPRC